MVDNQNIEYTQWALLVIVHLTSAWAMFGFILAIDSELNLPPGTFIG